MNISDEEKLVLGEFCEHVLMNEAFTFIANHYETSTVQQLLSTKPQERGRRDELYSAIRGVRDFLDLMASLVAEKNRLLDPTPKPSEDDVDTVLLDEDDDA